MQSTKGGVGMNELGQLFKSTMSIGHGMKKPIPQSQSIKSTALPEVFDPYLRATAKIVNEKFQMLDPNVILKGHS